MFGVPTPETKNQKAEHSFCVWLWKKWIYSSCRVNADPGLRSKAWRWTAGTTRVGVTYQGHGWNRPGTDYTQENPLWLTKNEILKEYIHLKGRGRKRSQTKKLNETDNLERIKFTPELLRRFSGRGLPARQGFCGCEARDQEGARAPTPHTSTPSL